jgi:hypothetical protein
MVAFCFAIDSGDLVFPNIGLFSPINLGVFSDIFNFVSSLKLVGPLPPPHRLYVSYAFIVLY